MLVGLIIAIVAALGLGFGWLIYVFNYNGSGSGVKTEDYKKLESEMSRQKEIVASQREELMRNRENLDELVREKSRIEANLEVLQELRGNLEGERNALKTETDLKNERIKELEIEKAQWQGGEKGRQYEEEEVKKRVEKLRKELEELCERHRLAIRGEEEEENGVKVRFRFELDGKEKKVCSLIREIGDLYPSLASDLYKIE